MSFVDRKENSAGAIGACPKCGKEIKSGKFGFYCTGKCGMNPSAVFGKKLTEAQLTKLLSGKSISFTSNGYETTVYPEVSEREYNGKTYYSWKSSGKKKDG